MKSRSLATFNGSFRRMYSSCLAVAFVALLPAVSTEALDCTNSPITVAGGTVTFTEDLVSNGGQLPCVRILYGGTADFAGYSVTCNGACGAAVRVEGSPPLTSTVTIKNGRFSGGWSKGIDALDAYQKPVVIQSNTFTDFPENADIIFGGTRIEKNVILGFAGLSDGVAVWWAPISTSVTAASYQFVKNNYIHFIGGYGIRVRPNGYFAPGKTPAPPDIANNFIAGPITVISEEGDRIYGTPTKAEVYNNILVEQSYAVDPFPTTPGGDLVSRPGAPNVCDLQLIASAAFGSNPDVCPFPQAPFTLP